jgi:tetratricopeptide (TPR) repeat protein
MPVSVRAVVAERLERLGEEARGVLAWASVLGPEFTLPLLQEVAGLEEEKLLDAVERALAARVLTPRPALGQEAYAFTDNQTREVLYEGISPVRRRRYHLKAGHAIEKVHVRRPSTGLRTGLEEHYDALAIHFLEGNDLPRAAEYAIKAGERSAAVYAWERATTHYQTALELLEELEADPRQQAEVLEKLAQVTGLGRDKDALSYWEKALSIYEGLGDGKKAAGVHLRLAQQYSYEVSTWDPERSVSHCEKAIKFLEPEGESSQLAQAYARLGLMAAHRHGLPSSGTAPLEKGLALAERLGDAAGVADAATSLGHVLVFHAGEIKRGLELAHRGYEAAERSGDVVALGEAAWQLSNSYTALKDADNALKWADQAVAAASQSGAFRHRLLTLLTLTWVSILRGDVPRALSSMETAQQLASKAGIEVSGVTAPPVIVPGLLHVFLGDWDKGETELLRRLEAAKQNHPVIRVLATTALGLLYLEQANPVSAKNHLQEAVSISQARGEKTQEVLPCVLLAEAAAKSGSPEEVLAPLRRAQEILANGEDWRGLAAEVRLAEGILAAAQRRWEEAEAAFQQAVEINRQYHLPYYEARSLLEWGEMYLSRSGPGDREQGMHLLDQALEIFQRVQAKKMVEKALARKGLLKA